MLNNVTDMLIKHDLLQPQETVYYSVRAQGNWSVLAFITKKRYYHIKMNQTGTLLSEYKLLKQLFKNFQDYMPFPMDYIQHEGREFMLSQAYEHCVLTCELIENSPNVQKQMSDYFIKTLSLLQTSSHTGQDNLLKEFLLKQHPLTKAQQEYLCHIEEALRKKGMIPQHGDLVLNNIALTGNSLILFDWEDYAKIAYPGFDLATLLLSLYEFDIAALTDALLERDCLDLMVQHPLEAISLTKEVFLSYLPLYLYIFLYLKQSNEYGEEVINRTKSCFEVAMNKALDVA